MIKYTLMTVTKDTDHPASKYVDDEKLLIVVCENGDWYRADEFFNIEKIKEFYVKKE